MVIHHTLSFTVVINIIMGWTFTMKLPGDRNADLFRRVKPLKIRQHQKDYHVLLRPERLSRVVVSVGPLLSAVLESAQFAQQRFIFLHGLSQKNVGCYCPFPSGLQSPLANHPHLQADTQKSHQDIAEATTCVTKGETGKHLCSFYQRERQESLENIWSKWVKKGFTVNFSEHFFMIKSLI